MNRTLNISQHIQNHWQRRHLQIANVASHAQPCTLGARLTPLQIRFSPLVLDPDKLL